VLRSVVFAVVAFMPVAAADVTFEISPAAPGTGLSLLRVFAGGARQYEREEIGFRVSPTISPGARIGDARVLVIDYRVTERDWASLVFDLAAPEEAKELPLLQRSPDGRLFATVAESRIGDGEEMVDCVVELRLRGGEFAPDLAALARRPWREAELEAVAASLLARRQQKEATAKDRGPWASAEREYDTLTWVFAWRLALEGNLDQVPRWFQLASLYGPGLSSGGKFFGPIIEALKQRDRATAPQSESLAGRGAVRCGRTSERRNSG
jgi:hypothetical protein